MRRDGSRPVWVGRVENVARTGRPIGHLLRRKHKRAWKDHCIVHAHMCSLSSLNSLRPNTIPLETARLTRVIHVFPQRAETHRGAKSTEQRDCDDKPSGLLRAGEFWLLNVKERLPTPFIHLDRDAAHDCLEYPHCGHVTTRIRGTT